MTVTMMNIAHRSTRSRARLFTATVISYYNGMQGMNMERRPNETGARTHARTPVSALD